MKAGDRITIEGTLQRVEPNATHPAYAVVRLDRKADPQEVSVQIQPVAANAAWWQEEMRAREVLDSSVAEKGEE